MRGLAIGLGAWMIALALPRFVRHDAKAVEAPA